MIVVEGMNIIMSYGDTFLVTFNIGGYVLATTDTVKLSIKERIDSTAVLLEKELTGLTGSAVTFDIDKVEFMNAVGKGNKVYDLLLSYGEDQKKSTLNFPAKLTIKEVVHSG